MRIFAFFTLNPIHMHRFSDPIVQAAADFYVLAIGTGEPEAAIAQYAGDRYVQHNLSVKDGKKGFIDYFKSFCARVPQRKVEVIRGFRDGPFVFIHVLQDLGDSGLWVTMDVFLTENGKIVEHWDNIEKATDHAMAQQMIGGPTAVADTHLSEANKAIVRRHLTEGLMRQDIAAMERDVDTGTYRHHMAPAGGDWAQLRPTLFLPNGQMVVRYEMLHRLIGAGNFVATQTEGSMQGQPVGYYDLFRLENEKIVEHWNLVEPIPSPEKWAHQNGKF